MKHVNFATYPRGNGHVEFTNKVLKTLLTKLANDNRINWDEYLSTMLFSCKIAYKVITGVYTMSIIVWITSINAHKVHHSNCWWR
jgi:hypothetical protein